VTLRTDVERLGGGIGERNAAAYAGLVRAADYIEGRFREDGLEPVRDAFMIGDRPFHNLAAEVRGGPEVVVVGAHYDSVIGCPGANDNASGVAAVLALAGRLGGTKPARTLRFLAFVNEEPPHFQTDQMGSLVYARRCRERKDAIVAMLSLETIGYYSDAEGSQQYPAPLRLFYPSKGDFVAFVGNLASRSLVREVMDVFRREAGFPCEGAALPGWLQGVGWSDHWSFWQAGYPGVMVTDTAPFRYPHYHTPEDTPDKLDYERLGRVVDGLERVVRRLARIP
jgi:Zn-dependent M28 family amino/carboxypeptidase